MVIEVIYKEGFDYPILKKTLEEDELKEPEDDLFSSSSYTAYWKWLKPKILNRDKRRCTQCNTKIKLELHHIDGKGRNVPLSQRNSHPSNLITLCKECHYLVENNFQFITPNNKDIKDWINFKTYCEKKHLR